MSKKEVKRERSVNFTSEEMDILMNLIEKNKNILENKRSDAVTWQEKESCWKAIEAAFNSLSGHTYRSAKNLKIKYDGLKRETRKKSACISAETYRTGGGPSTATPLTPTEDKLKSMILLSVDGMKSDFDSDHVVTVVSSQSETTYDSQNIADETNTENINSIDQIDMELSLEDPIAFAQNETPVRARPISRKQLPTTKENVDDGNSEGEKKMGTMETYIFAFKETSALCNSKPKRPFEKLAEAKLEVAELQKKILEEELKHKMQEMEEQCKRWKFDEEDRQRKQKFEEEEREHKRNMLELEKKYMSINRHI